MCLVTSYWCFVKNRRLLLLAPQCVLIVSVSIAGKKKKNHGRRLLCSLQKLMLGIILDELRLNPPAAGFSPDATLPLLFQFNSLFSVSQIEVPIWPQFFHTPVIWWVFANRVGLTHRFQLRQRCVKDDNRSDNVMRGNGAQVLP